MQGLNDKKYVYISKPTIIYMIVSAVILALLYPYLRYDYIHYPTTVMRTDRITGKQEVKDKFGTKAQWFLTDESLPPEKRSSALEAYTALKHFAIAGAIGYEPTPPAPAPSAPAELSLSDKWEIEQMINKAKSDIESKMNSDRIIYGHR